MFVQYLHALHVIKAFPFVRMLNRLPLWIAKRISKDIELGHELEQVRRMVFQYGKTLREHTSESTVGDCEKNRAVHA